MSPSNSDHLPIKVVIPAEGDIHRPRNTRTVPKDFSDDYDRIREVVLLGIDQLAEYFEPKFAASNLPVVARVGLREDAIAKSHRPSALFDQQTCPIIGAEYFGQLLVSVRPGGLDRLRQAAQGGPTKLIRNDVAKLTAITPFTPQDALGDWSVEAFLEHMAAHRQKSFKLRLFDHRNERIAATLSHHLTELASSLNLSAPEALPFCSRMHVYDFPAATREHLEAATAFVGTQGVAVYEDLMVSTSAIERGPVTPEHLPPPEDGIDYPVVGLLDTGTDPGNPRIQQWVVARRNCGYIPQDQNNDHGTLVAGLLINSQGLNHGDTAFPTCKAKIVDVVAMPGTGRVGEREILENIAEALAAHPDVKIWNMSLNKETPCHESSFSYFAIALDEIQDRYGALIFNSAGNFSEIPAPTWPRPNLGGRDRLYQPGESLRCLTVGSVAHRDRADACVKPGEPSPFSRCGPGSAFVPKPELTHVGGNTNPSLDCSQMGVISVNANGRLAETVGTSFATPLVSVTAAALRHSLEGDPSRHLLKALLVHSAVLCSRDISATELPYYGFGTPPNIDEILRCRPWEATLIFEMDLPYAQRHFHKADFPIPPCLHRNGTVSGELVMTMACDPPLDPGEGAAYSLVNIKPAIGRCKDGDVPGETDEFKGQVVPYPKRISQLFEDQQIRHGYKWAPVKVFKAKMTRLAVWDNWQISIKMEARNYYQPMGLQPAALIVTIRDPHKQQPVYNEVVTMMNRVGWQTQNLQVREQIRVRSVL